MWVTGKNCGSQQTHLRTAKSLWGAHARAGAVAKALAPSEAETLVGFSVRVRLCTDEEI